MTDSLLAVTVAQDTSAGRKESNEDSMGLLVPASAEVLASKGVCAVLADGVSSADAGREAAETCVQSFLNDYFSTPDTWTVETSARKVLSAINRWLYSRSNRFVDAAKGYVCTLSILVIKSRTAYIFYVGDTRVYRLRQGALEQLTRDHAVRVSGRTSYLARAMGLDSSVSVDLKRQAVFDSDVYLLTTDGIHDYLPAESMGRILAESADLQAACRRLIAEAHAAGSPDNLTCQLVRVDALPDTTADEYVQHLTELPFPPELSPGMVLDGFRVERELHASARSQVYLVTELATGQERVMKTPSVNYEQDPAYIERFILEHWIGTRVKSRHLLESIAHPPQRSCLYNLAEYIPGQTLEAWIAQRARKPVRDSAEVVALIAQVGRGLIALHRREILHQDLKPGNIIVASDGTVKIIDYGSCYVAGVEEIAAPIVRDKILGTASYAAPEYALGDRIDRSADTFSLGCITYEMLTGQHPYGSGAAEARTRADFERLVYTPAYQLNPHVPVWMDGALRKATALEPRERYAELTEFLFDIEHPNPEYLRGPSAAVAPRNGWRQVALVLLVMQLGTWAWIALH